MIKVLSIRLVNTAEVDSFLPCGLKNIKKIIYNSISTIKCAQESSSVGVRLTIISTTSCSSALSTSAVAGPPGSEVPAMSNTSHW